MKPITSKTAADRILTFEGTERHRPVFKAGDGTPQATQNAFRRARLGLDRPPAAPPKIRLGRPILSLRGIARQD